MKPPRSILDKSFVYRNAAATDVRATFERIRSELQAKLAEQQRDEAERQAKVTAMTRKR